MKVVYVIPYDWGGLPHYTVELANSVSKYENVIILCNTKFDTSKISKNIKVLRVFEELNFNLDSASSMLSLQNFKGFYSYKNLYIINKIKPDIIHFTTPLFPPIPFLITMYGISRNYPIVRTIHSMLIQRDYTSPFIEFANWLIDQCYRIINTDAIIVHTEKDKEHLVGINNALTKKIYVIPHMAYNSFLKYSIKASDNISYDEDCVLFFGYIKSYKGLEYLLKAVPLIYKKLNNIKLVIAGQGDLSKYSDIIRDCPKQTVEIYNEFLSNEMVATLFQRAKVVVLPYTQMSGMSGIINIAYAFGKPVVATDVWGFNEALENGVHGFLVPPKNPNALADAIIKILNDESLRKEMERNVLIKASDISGDNIAKKHVGLYNNVIKQRLKSR